MEHVVADFEGMWEKIVLFILMKPILRIIFLICLSESVYLELSQGVRDNSELTSGVIFGVIR